MKTFHREKLTGHTDAIFEEIPAIICDDSRSSKLQENDPFHRNVWPGLKVYIVKKEKKKSPCRCQGCAPSALSVYILCRGGYRCWSFASHCSSFLLFPLVLFVCSVRG